MEIVSANGFTGVATNFHYDRDPFECPFCHKSITPRFKGAYWKEKLLEMVFGCPDVNCGRIFVAQYIFDSNDNSFKYKSSTIGTFVDRKFSDNIIGISKSFFEIYNQALKAETLNLEHISGLGYRKAFEFLIKDYLTTKYPEKAENISKKLLGKCIKDDVDNLNLKEMAERAAWLGNDETHYIRKWISKDVQDLKKLIDVSLHWIEMELLTDIYKSEMTADK